MKKRIRLSLLFGFLCAMLLSMTSFEAICDDLRENVLRLHIIANSDSPEDQELKLKIRDEILINTEAAFKNAERLEVAECEAKKRLSEFSAIANRVIKENGFDYKAEVSLGDSFFETREYETFTLPAGNYRSLIIKLGKAEGKNWWCVVFPSVCVPAASGSDLRDSVKDKSATVAEQSDRYIVKFKAVEIYEKIRSWFC